MYTCQMGDASQCLCGNTFEPIYGPDATLYPKAGCFRVGKTLYNARAFFHALGKHTWQTFIQHPERGVSTGRSRLDLHFMRLRLSPGAEVSVFFDPFVNRVLPIALVRRIQRAMRCCLQRKNRLAVAMGLHWRLGVGCLLAGVLEDLVEGMI
jgi:hypothetical protein